MSTDKLNPVADFMGDVDRLLSVAQGDKEYVQPALKNLGSVCLPILREVISPAVFRNQEQEITDIEAHGVRRVRAVANKFKFGERARGLQILRLYEAGGRHAQNKTSFKKDARPSTGFDLNTVVFGDSANADKYVWPVKATAQYSDAISVASYGECVGSTFHNRASEDGSLFDAEEKKNSNNLFERHFVRPGTLLLQTITFNGRTAPMEALEHLLLSIGLAGAYGGQTSVYGVNVRSHPLGLFAARLERDISSPYVALQNMAFDDPSDVAEVAGKLQAQFARQFPVVVNGADVCSVQESLVGRLERNDPALRTRYNVTADKVGKFFDAWFQGK